MRLPIIPFGERADALSLGRVLLASLAYATVLGLVGYVFDLLVGPAIEMFGWWTVTAFGGFIMGVLIQCVHEYAKPLRPPPEVSSGRPAD